MERGFKRRRGEDRTAVRGLCIPATGPTQNLCQLYTCLYTWAPWTCHILNITPVTFRLKTTSFHEHVPRIIKAWIQLLWLCRLSFLTPQSRQALWLRSWMWCEFSLFAQTAFLSFFFCLFVLGPCLSSAKLLNSLLIFGILDENKKEKNKAAIWWARAWLLGMRVRTYPARVLRPCPAAWLPKATTLSPVPRYQPVESRLEALWGKGRETELEVAVTHAYWAAVNSSFI